jgi:hypothetical protein
LVANQVGRNGQLAAVGHISVAVGPALWAATDSSKTNKPRGTGNSTASTVASVSLGVDFAAICEFVAVAVGKSSSTSSRADSSCTSGSRDVVGRTRIGTCSTMSRVSLGVDFAAVQEFVVVAVGKVGGAGS